MNLTHVLAERWDMQKEGITQHLRHTSFFTGLEELVLRENLVSVTGKPSPHAGCVHCFWRVAELLIVVHGFHLCVLTDLLATLGPCHQMP